MCAYSWRVPLTLAGELKVSAYTDLGGLGAKQGPAASFVWTVPNFLPVLLPWLVILGLLALPSNRQARAWWIWVPLAGMAFVGIGLGTAAGAASNEGLNFSAQAGVAATFGLAAVWLLAAALARCWRALGIVFMALAFAAVSLLTLFVSPVWEQVLELIGFAPQFLWYLLIYAVLSGLAYAGALNLTGWRCRERFSRLRCSLWLPIGLWAMWLVAGGLGAWIVAFFSRGHFDWGGLLVGPVVLALISFGLILPFLILSFTNSFYRARLQCLLRLPAAEPPAAVPVAEPQSVQELPD